MSGNCTFSSGSTHQTLCRPLRLQSFNSTHITSSSVCLVSTLRPTRCFSRKSDPANLALTGMVGYAVTKCFLNKSIFTYMVESAASKEVRSRNQESSPHQRLRPNNITSSPGRGMLSVTSSRETHSTRQRTATDTWDVVRNETKHGDWTASRPKSTNNLIPLANRHRKVAAES